MTTPDAGVGMQGLHHHVRCAVLLCMSRAFREGSSKFRRSSPRGSTCSGILVDWRSSPQHGLRVHADSTSGTLIGNAAHRRM